jgi:hypothetical protein
MRVRALRTVGTLAIGVLVGALGTVAHRGHQPWGVVLALTLVLAAGVMSRAWNGWPGLVGYAVGLVVSVQLLSRTGPGGDVLVTAGAAVSWVWVVGSLVALVLAALAPRRLFDPRPLPARRAAGEGSGG